MKDFPHQYEVSALANVDGDIETVSAAVPPIFAASPAEFGGPGDRWSPETLLVAAVADCFILTFRAVAAASKVTWTSLRCEVTGTLDRIDRVTQFTAFDVHARLQVAAGINEDLARRALEKAEHHCLITNSLKAATTLRADIAIVGAPAGALSGT
jgi:uncharacterized OsmC-like protein